MDKVVVRLVVFFEEPFWVGVFEQVFCGKLSVYKITFGPEPKDYEVYDFILKNYYGLQFGFFVKAAEKKANYNPKRMQRKIHKQLQDTGIETKSQKALKLQQQQMKTQRNIVKRKKKEEIKQRQFELKQQKKKEKHKGR